MWLLGVGVVCEAVKILAAKEQAVKPILSPVPTNYRRMYSYKKRKVTGLDIQVLKALAAANNKLPDNAFLAYEGVEVAEFNFDMCQGIELVNGVAIKASFIQRSAFSLRFDQQSSIL